MFWGIDARYEQDSQRQRDIVNSASYLKHIESLQVIWGVKPITDSSHFTAGSPGGDIKTLSRPRGELVKCLRLWRQPKVMNHNRMRVCFGTKTPNVFLLSQIPPRASETHLSCTGWVHICTGINIIFSSGIRRLSLEIQVCAVMAICAHHATVIYNDTPGNAASRFICNANTASGPH